VVFCDASRVRIREDNVVRNKAAYGHAFGVLASGGSLRDGIGGAA
jgi:transposase-like protein